MAYAMKNELLYRHFNNDYTSNTFKTQLSYIIIFRYKLMGLKSYVYVLSISAIIL